MALDATRLANTIVSNIEAIPNFPVAGQSPVFSDTRVIQAIAKAIVSEIQGNADVLPAAHAGEGLSAPANQPVLIPSTSSPGEPSDGETTTDTVIVGKGSIQ